jgi:hypothetical protein
LEYRKLLSRSWLDDRGLRYRFLTFMYQRLRHGSRDRDTLDSQVTVNDTSALKDAVNVSFDVLS